MDEATLSLEYPLRRCWMKRGQQQTYPAHTGFRHLLHLLGAFDWQQDCIYTHTVSHKSSPHFITFLEYVCLDLFPDDPLVLVLDNVSYHRSADVLAFLALLAPRVQVIWLPPYSPELNPIERFWLHLKNHVYANRLFPSLDALLLSTLTWLAIQNSPAHPDRLVFAKSFRQFT